MNRVPSFRALPAVSGLDDMIFQRDDVFRLGEAELSTFRDEVLLLSLADHLERSDSYRSYCAARGFALAGGVPDWSAVPLIPSLSFKETTVLSGDPVVVKVCESSGTRGSISRVHRDDVTLNRFLGSVGGSTEQVLGVEDAFCFNLGPSAEEDPDLWFSYAMAAAALIFPTTNCVLKGEVRFDLLVEEFDRARRSFEHVLVVGAPVMVRNLVRDLAARDVTFPGGQLVVVTAGGWKRYDGEALDRDELFALVTDRFPGFARDRFRDTLNLVELNTLLPDCERGWKHVPPWVLVRTVDPVTLDDAGPGAEGLIGYLDASATSYPGFILSDDVGVLASGAVCSCGRTGQRLRIRRRVVSEESRGCALKLDRDYSPAGKVHRS